MNLDPAGSRFAVKGEERTHNCDTAWLRQSLICYLPRRDSVAGVWFGSYQQLIDQRKL